MESMHGIFCLEGDWWGNPTKQTSVEPALTLLRNTEGFEIPYKHRNVSTRTEFEHHLEKWQQANHDGLPILYLAFHGEEGELIVGGDARRNDARVNLDWLEERVNVTGQNRMMYLGTCSTLAIHGTRINRFLENTGLSAICGYEGPVDWMQSTVFDLLLLASLCRLATVTPMRIWNAYEATLKLVSPLAKQLRFRMEAHPSIHGSR